MPTTTVYFTAKVKVVMKEEAAKRRSKERRERKEEPFLLYDPNMRKIFRSKQQQDGRSGRRRRLWCSHLQGEPAQKGGGRSSGGGVSVERCQEKEEEFVR
jgi:hypothetical protein